MKKSIIKLFTICLLSFWSINSFAQLNISTNLRQDGIWDEAKEEWTLISIDEEELTFFEFNKEFTMFTHTTPSMTSAYIIKSLKENEEQYEYRLEVISDVGNKYLMIINYQNSSLRFFYKTAGDVVMVHHTIKQTWVEDV